MKTIFAAAAILSITAVAPTLTDYGAARSSYGRHVFLAEGNGASPGGRDTALYAEGESSGPTRGGKDGAMLAEASGPTSGGRDTALYAESESSGPTRGGQDSALLAEASGPSPNGRDTALA